ncbi:hypothetical protein T10_13257 [Trichinella papuae]|uniref:Uncharacterized protein n=1 Tax=Trichinella papuae TaxID=268474 RepID=A0A0V1MIU8_9BILA|nr:hypothetical protein T10_13257 [Trichinella papuae]
MPASRDDEPMNRILISESNVDVTIMSPSFSSKIRWKIRWHVFNQDKPQQWITILVIRTSVEISHVTNEVYLVER